MGNDLKAELIAQLARSRAQMSASLQGVRHDLDVPRRAGESFKRNAHWWLGIAAVSGWVLSRLPARKKKIYVDRSGKSAIREAGKTGLLLGLLKLIFSVAKPALMSFATQRLSDFARREMER